MESIALIDPLDTRSEQKGDSLELRVEQSQGDRGSRIHELSQVPRAGYTARAEYEKPIRARSDLEMVRTLTEVQQFTASEEFVLLGIVRAA